ncbi:MAG: homocysteine S-methyltransferase family protein [Bacteroidales bacterium]|nr:homocysteine S-methyltransferase family protein [Bacteroidales bacterium]
MQPIAAKIQLQKILISDGAWGTFLQEKGLAVGECPESWNLNRPDDVLAIAKSYIDAGADMIETNSFGANAFKLTPYGLADKVYELNKAAAQISRKAAGDNHMVLGSIGPTGKMLMMGDITPEQLYNAFRDQAIGLSDGGADALVVETMSDIDEAVLAVKACKENTQREVICTMTFEKTGEDAYHTMMGVTPEQMTEELVKAGASIIGTNCGNGMAQMIGIVKAIRLVNNTIPILVHANAGAPIYRDGKTVFPETPEQMASYVCAVIDAGANIIGGCCGTTPAHISLMVETAKKCRV